MAQAPRAPRPSVAFRGLPRLSAAFRAAHSMHIPRPFRAFRESRHVPQLPCLTLRDATHGINGGLLLTLAPHFTWSLLLVFFCVFDSDPLLLLFRTTALHTTPPSGFLGHTSGIPALQLLNLSSFHI